MIKKIPLISKPKFSLQYQLSFLALIFLFLYALLLTLSPAVRYRSWNVDFPWRHWIVFFIWLISFFYLNKLSTSLVEHQDQYLIPIIGLLTGWGILTIWRLNPYFGIRQAIWFLLCVVTSHFFFKKRNLLLELKRFKYLLLICGLVLATLTFFFGTYPGGDGPRLWLGARGLYFQPSELLKLVLIIYLSAYFSEKDFPSFRFINSIFPTLILLLSSLFILIGQRDMGTALIFIVIYILMIFIAYGKKRIIGIGIGLILTAGIIGFFLIDLIRIRFYAWVLPWLDPQAGSYQIIQSIISIAAGGLFGSGIGLGSPNIVPISHSDFIYTAIIEETGLMGGIGLLVLFGLLLFRGLIISINASNKYYRFLAAGISTYILAQAILIMGGNIRLLPITGVTLPFVSYGGSSLIISIFCAFILIIISNDRQKSIPINFNDQPYTIIGIIFSVALILVAAITGWWAIVRSYDLQHRVDNTRRLAASQYVKRGSILDRNNLIISESTGEVGSLKRFYYYPPLTNTVGYIHNKYGITGLESVFDDYLSGERGYAASYLWFNFFLYDQPPPGIDIRLTIDLNIQKQLDELLSVYKGSAVVLNPHNGEVLAISSHPYFDANKLDTKFEEWQKDEDAPFINRSIQGAYPVGEAILPFLLDENLLSELEQSETYFSKNFYFKGRTFSCALSEENSFQWNQAISNGCPSFLLHLPADRKWDLFNQAINIYELTGSPEIGFPTQGPSVIIPANSWYDLLYGDNLIRVNPLQMALSASVFSNEGSQPEINFLYAINAGQENWVVVSEQKQKTVISKGLADTISTHFLSSEFSGWEISAKGSEKDRVVSWYLAGTPPDWNGNPVIVVIVIEKDDPQSAREIGRAVYRTVTR